MIYLGADHRGFDQKKLVAKWLSSCGMEFEDMGAMSLSPEDDAEDFAAMVAEKVSGSDSNVGVLMCGSGHAVCIQANRFRGVRAINGLTPELAAVGRKHNDANILCLAADFVPEPSGVLRAFFETEFDGAEKYVRRNKKLDKEA